MWTHPKTDWKFDDDFDLYDDYFRIKNNILWLQKLIGEEYRPFALIPMNDYGVDGIGFADFFNKALLSEIPTEILQTPNPVLLNHKNNTINTTYIPMGIREVAIEAFALTA